jgi:enamine deaminase RidA (YjgF/YER057c/UK114 family)
MPNRHLFPETLYDSSRFDYAQVVIADGRKTVYVAGQTAWDRNLQHACGADLAAQLRQALENVRLALAAAGATPSDLVQLRTYIVNYSPSLLPAISPVLHAFLDPAHLPAATLLGVQSLALPELLVEVDAIAVIAA